MGENSGTGNNRHEGIKIGVPVEVRKEGGENSRSFVTEFVRSVNMARWFRLGVFGRFIFFTWMM